MDRDRTIGELAEHDKENFIYVRQQIRPCVFFNMQKALNFRALCIHALLKTCGINISKGMDHRFIQVQLDAQKVKLEDRKYPIGDPVYESGTYVYKADEIVGFVSPVVKSMGLQSYMVRTTVEVEA